MSIEAHNQQLRLFAKVDITLKQILKLLCSKIQSALGYFENTTLENIGAFLLNTPKTWIFLKSNLVKSALAFSINLNVPKMGIILIYQIENPNAKMHKYSKNLVVRSETHSKYFV
ncbi:hypothetical protein [Sulfurimonas sp.]|uniref:hypothetical protein n=1 Tax=Sulfurimonas sp. TaxID=2022749 RepID=UPI00286E2E47|nr:hypothetical protein [Sulfurimonas sp.]